MTRFSVRSAFATSVMALAMTGAMIMATGTAQAAATVVPLGTTATYAVLAGSGITNIGTTTINGDVGSSPTGTESGFAACPAANCVNLTGTNHTSADPNDAQTQGAKTALTTAFNNAAGQTPTTVLTELGGQTLVAGTYTAADGTFGMSGNLTLDGANNPASVFIFQTATTLTTAGAGNMTLINGAQACNVFWQIGSAATLGTGSTLDGTVMAHDDISLGAGVTVNGRLLAGEQASGAGAVTLNSDTIATSACAAPVVPPVTLPLPSASASASASAAAASAAAVKAAALKAAAAKAAAVKAAAASASAKAAAEAAALNAAGAGGPGSAQILRKPVGGVHTGDGSTIPRAGSVPPIAAAGIGVGAIMVAGLGVGSSALAHRRRRRF